MTEFEPGDDAIALMVDVARTGGLDLNAAQRRDLNHLVSRGLVAVDEASNSCEVTPKGQALLDQRGVGANEA